MLTKPSPQRPSPAHCPARRSPRGVCRVGLVLLATSFGVGLLVPVQSQALSAKKQCIQEQCKPLKAECIREFRQTYGATKAACATAATARERKTCKRTEAQKLRVGTRACKTAYKERCRPCCAKEVTTNCDLQLLCGDGTCPTIPEDTKGLEALGVGIDIFGEYAVEDNLLGRVLDVDKLNQDGMLILNTLVEERKYERLIGSTIRQYATGLGTSVGVSGSYMFFSASVKASFTNETYRRTEYSYATIIENNLKHSVKVSTDRWYADYLIGYLTPAAADAINNTDMQHGDWTPEQLLASYGTHVMLGVYVGARLDYNMALKIEEDADKSQFESYASAKFKGTFASASIQASIDSTTETRMNGYDKTVNIRSKGGDSQWADPTNTEDYNQWHNSINTKPVFCGILKNALIPIWEFADTPERQAAIQEAYTSYAKGKDSEFTPLLPRRQVITDVKVINTVGSGNVSLPSGYKLLLTRDGRSTWINEYAFTSGYGQGDHVWVAYKDAWNDESGVDPIDDVHVVGGGIYTAWLNDQIFATPSHAARYGSTCQEEGVNLNSGTCGNSSGRGSDWLCRGEYAVCTEGNKVELYLHTTKNGGHPIGCLAIGNYISVDANKTEKERLENLWWGPRDVDEDGDVDDDDGRLVLNSVHWAWNETSAVPVNLNWSAVRYWLEDEGLGCWSAYWNYGVPAQHIGYCVIP